MRLFAYYAFHTFVNQVRKLMKTWVLLFLVACLVLGGLIGLGTSLLAERVENNNNAEQTEETDVPPEREAEDGPSAAEIEARNAMIELVAGGVVLVMLFLQAFGADKNGSRIFKPADVNLLFPSPMQPQSVLFFRLMTQLGMVIVMTIYMLIQLPNLTLNLGLGIWAALAVIAAWGILIFTAQLVQALLYTLCSTRPELKKHLRTALYAVLIAIAGGFFFFWQSSGDGPLQAAFRFFNAPGTRYIPLWGWIKGFCMYAVEGNRIGVLLSLAGMIALDAVLGWVIWHVRADFYEDAMAQSEETAALLEKAQSEKEGLLVRRRKKDRSERLQRDGMRFGAGANVFFFKSMYNRFRFAQLHVLTKTMVTYLLAAAAGALFCRYALQTELILPVVLVLTGCVFFRALGNPLEQDTRTDFFRMIPERTWSKLLWSLLGGTANCLLDVLPALLLGAILMQSSVLTALAWLPFIVSMDFYATTVGAFIALSVPVSAGKTVKQLVQILFIYFGLLPVAVIMAVALVSGHPVLGAVCAAALNTGLGFLFLGVSPRFLEA